MALFLTGDTHGDFRRFLPENFYEQERLTDVYKRQILEALNEFAQADSEVKEDMLNFTQLVWAGQEAEGTSLISLKQRLGDITAEQALLLDRVLENMDCLLYTSRCV